MEFNFTFINYTKATKINCLRQFLPLQYIKVFFSVHLQVPGKLLPHRPVQQSSIAHMIEQSTSRIQKESTAAPTFYPCPCSKNLTHMPFALFLTQLLQFTTHTPLSITHSTQLCNTIYLKLLLPHPPRPRLSLSLSYSLSIRLCKDSNSLSAS